MEIYPKITVVVPIRNEEAFIAQTLNYLREQDYPHDKLEILVVDGESDDRTVAIVSAIAGEDSRVKLLSNPKRLSSAARALGASEASGEIVTFVDGHTYIDNDQLIKSTAQLMQAKEVEALSRPQFLETPENDHFQRAVALARRSAIGHGLDSTIYTDKDMYVDPSSSGASYKKSVFAEVGNFDERFDACEDVEFNYRVHKSGRRSFTSLALAVYYYPRDSIRGLFRQMKRYGVGRARLARKHPETLSLGTLIPVAFTVGLVLLPLLGLLVHSLFGWLFLGGYGLYFLMILLTAMGIGIREGAGYTLPVLAILPTIHLGLGYGFLEELGRVVTGRAVSVKS